jgi:superfamily II DNA or RNA helicase
MISYFLKTLIENKQTEKAIIIVPSIGLVTQFYSDMEEYGIDISMVGKVGDNLKEWDKPITISTWQTLQNCPERMKDYDCVIVDEVHGAKASVLQELLSNCDNATWRIGFTGTMPDDKLEEYQVMSYLGPVLKEYGSVELAKLGYVAECHIKMVHLSYNKEPKGTYDDVKNQVFRNEYRLSLIEEIIRNIDGSVLLLVGKVKDEGDFLLEYLNNKFHNEDKEVMFLSGRDNSTEREKWRKYTDSKNNIILIASYGIFQQGINVKSLKNLILAAPFKSKIRVLQSIGRTLRLHADKKDGALIWDVCDGTKHLRKHSDIRLKHYNKEGFDIEDIYLSEGDEIKNALFE